MNFLTYADLKSAIADELNRTDLDAAIPAFVSLMEVQTERLLRTREMLKTVSSFTVDSELEALPSDFLDTRSIYLNTDPITPLDFLTVDAMQDFKQVNSGIGKPTRYTVLGTNFQFLKVPDTTYTATLVYYSRIPRLSDTQTSNWLLQYHPDIYFYGSLVNSAPYLKEDARIQVWAQLYQTAIAALKSADDRSQTASNNLTATARTF